LVQLLLSEYTIAGWVSFPPHLFCGHALPWEILNPWDIKKTWVDIPDVGQKGVIQDGVQDGRRTLISNITPSASVLE